MLDVVIKVGTINPSTEELKYHFHTIFEVARELLMENDNRDQVSEEERIDQSRDQGPALPRAVIWQLWLARLLA